MERVVIVISIYNRINKTLAFLRSIYDQQNIWDKYNISIIIIDDMSEDGSKERIEKEYKDVKIIRTEGNYFWSRSMSLGMQKAIENTPDYLIIANDDTYIYPDSISRLIEYAKETSSSVVGAFSDENQRTSYSGMLKKSRINPLNLYRIDPKEDLIEIDAFNGNLVIIPASAFTKVGVISDQYSHAYGDLDYSMRIKKAGERIVLAPGYVGTCSRNPVQGTYLDRSLPVLDRVKLSVSRKGVPFRDTYIFYKRNGPSWWLILLTWKYIRLFSAVLLNRQHH